MNDLTGAKVLKVERILFNAFKDIYFSRKINYLFQRSKMLINFDICGFECNIVWATKLDYVKVHYFRSAILRRIYVEKFRYL
jgi:hypothetical protein